MKIKKTFYIFFIFIVFSNLLLGQTNSLDFLEFNGKVINSENKEPLIFANIGLVESNISTISNSNGDFIIKIPKNHPNRKIKISFIGFKTVKFIYYSIYN